jgi:hypothetical protein
MPTSFSQIRANLLKATQAMNEHDVVRVLRGYNVGSVRIPGIVEELAVSHVEQVPKLVAEDLVGVDQVAVGIVLVDELAFDHGANAPALLIELAPEKGRTRTWIEVSPVPGNRSLISRTAPVD